MEDKKEFLAQTILFKGLSDKHLESISKIAYPKKMRKGELIFQEGDESHGFYIVYAGRVKIYKESPSGKEQIIHLFGPGEPFGEVPVFSGFDFPANALALTDGELLYFPRKEFVGLIKDDPSLALNILGVLSQRLRQLVNMVEALALKEVSERLASYLLYLGEQAGGDIFDLGMNKTQLASFLGTSPETLSRMFGRLQKLGLIETQGRQVKILDREGLSEVAAGIKPFSL
ncbi:Crp/Fnr family transcriptional regulator [Thermodesulfatator autotrophicus]|uniref:Transcriptional regulator n=1 Tax=Thermodesulfatator autotrophicus TaxID=1795632 RepID=A0A177E8R4_9BACT|nr:Crp/Fnr family transcriptional regulator [Thermodesulfatator autotrophicus]OAG28305.1 transcriptional regulator [Thermodesulfatator autotrophicus]